MYSNELMQDKQWTLCVCLSDHVDTVSLFVSGYFATGSHSSGIYEGGFLGNESEYGH